MKENQPAYLLGIDIGSVSVKTALLDAAGNIVAADYRRSFGRPYKVLLAMLEELTANYAGANGALAAMTGTGSRSIASALGLPYVNEVIAQAKATEKLHPETWSIIEIGGQDSKLILIRKGEAGNFEIEDFTMNTICAAGTGSFLDQQASRLGIKIEDEFGQLALKSGSPPRIAGRCSVFAKSDMIHLQQQATPDYDIVAGLCFALIRNFVGNVCKGREFKRPVAFQGGTAANAGLVRALREILELGEDELIIPEHHATMGAIGAVLVAAELRTAVPFKSLDRLREYIRSGDSEGLYLSPLEIVEGDERRHWCGFGGEPDNAKDVKEVYLGVDVGSISTNVVAIDPDGKLSAKSYLMTAGRPIEAVRAGLSEVAAKLAPDVKVLGVGTTGSGRYLTGDIVGADIVRNEITAHATGAAHLDPKVDTIFEIGGQDSKYISLDNGVVVDFEMNHACAAGTGSFLEEQAERLGISVKDEFAELALSAEKPLKLGERCTVFMETDVLAHQHRGAQTDQLVAGLAYSIVSNYLNRVVGCRKIGNHIFYQGGTAANKAIVAAFEKVTGKMITVPPHHEVIGAIGCALLARDEMLSRSPDRRKSNFVGFDFSHKKYTVTPFECKHCPNNCEIRKVEIEGQKPLFYGSRCDRYNLREKTIDPRIPDLFAEREKLLFEKYEPARRPHRGKIGVPRALVFWEQYPFWQAFLSELGYEVVLSGPTTKSVIQAGVEAVASQSCFPVKVLHGHTESLLKSDVDYIFLPSIIDLDNDFRNQEISQLCPYVQTMPYQIMAAMNPDASGKKILRPIIYFSRAKKTLRDFGRSIGASRREVERAMEAAAAYRKRFINACIARGREVLEELDGSLPVMVVVSRPYNGCDPGLNLELAKKMREHGIIAVPLDFLPLTDEHLTDDWENMYWRYGQRILAAAKFIRDSEHLGAVYVSNFSCGPDSFVTNFFRRQLEPVPVLVLEIDEHSADAGVITRLEAYMDSLSNAPARAKVPHRRRIFPAPAPMDDRTLYIPRMCEHAHALAAAFRAGGQDAQVLPMSDDESVLIGRRFTNGKECLPAIITCGDMVKKVMEPGFDPRRAAFFMPSGSGPCRFGQYHKLHRLALDQLGYPDIPILAPNQGRSFYKDFAKLKHDPTRQAWRGIALTDLLYKALHRLRPYEKNPGETDRVFAECIEELTKTIESDGDVFARAREFARRFAEIPVDLSREKPLIGIVGEIYVRSHRFSNQDIIRKLEMLGAEVDPAMFGEWIYYTNFTRWREAWHYGDWMRFFGNKLKDRVQRREEARLARHFRQFLRQPVEPPTKTILDLARPYVDDTFEGETVLSIGKAIEMLRHNVSGIVNVMPFTCMPGTIVTGLMKKLREDHDQLPFISLAYDGQEDGTTITRLEAFVHQATQFAKRKKDKRASAGAFVR